MLYLMKIKEEINGKTKVKYCCSMISGDGITSQVISDIKNDENLYPVYGGNGQRGYYGKYNSDGEYILIGRQGALAGNVHRTQGKIWAADHAIVVTCNDNNDIVFMYYLFIMMDLNRYAQDTAAQPGLAVSKIMALPCIIPDINTQKKIATYIEHKCSEIEVTETELQHQIELLQEYKQSVITEAVTKGLDKNVAMKDSGIEWTKTKVKYCCSMISGDGITSQVIADFEDAENIYPVYGGNGQRGYYCKYNRNGEYILIGRQGALAGNVHRVNDKFWATDHAIVVTCNNKSDIGFMYYLFIMMNLNRYALDTAAQPGLAVSKVMALPCNVPNIDTQREISYYLDSKCAEIDAVLADKQKQLHSLTEYKKSLIYEYVTGKKEVPADA